MKEKGHTWHTLFQSKGRRTDAFIRKIRKCFQSLKDELIFALYFLSPRKLEVSLIDL